MRPLAFTLSLVALIFAAGPLAAEDGGTSVTIKLPKVQKDDGGVIVCRIFDDEGWLDSPLSEKRTSQFENAKVTFTGLKPGTYAAACFHDTDDNNKLTFGMFWSPKEGNGFPNEYRPSFKPNFKKASFKASGPTTVVVKLVYP